MDELTLFPRILAKAEEEKRIAEEDRLYKIKLAEELEQKAAERRSRRIRQFAMNCIYGIGGMALIGALGGLMAVLAVIF